MPMIKNKHIRMFLTCVASASAAVSVSIAGPAAAASAQPVRAHTQNLPISVRFSPTPMPTIGQPAPEQSPKAPVTLNSLRRTESGLVALTWTITNSGYDQYIRPADWVGIYNYANASESAITITDEAAKIRYNPLRIDPDRMCMCTDAGGMRVVQNQGQSEIIFEVYKVPENVKAVTVDIPGFSPAKNISIS